MKVFTIATVTLLVTIFTLLSVPELSAQTARYQLVTKLDSIHSPPQYVDVSTYVEGWSTFYLGSSTFVYSYAPSTLTPPNRNTWIDTNIQFSSGAYSLSSNLASPWRMSVGIFKSGFSNLGGHKVTDTTTSWTFLTKQRWGLPSQFPSPPNDTVHFSWVLNGGGSVTALLTATMSPVTNDTLFSINVQSPMPVELAAFSGRFMDGEVRLRWTTASEINSFAFDVERSVNGEDFFTIGSVPAQGVSNIPHDYVFDDAQPGMDDAIWYRLKMIDRDGTHTHSRALLLRRSVADATARIEGVYPNPMRDRAVLEFSIPNDEKVTIIFCDEGGREVLRLVDEERLAAGYYARTVTRGRLPSGRYVVRMAAGATMALQSLLIEK